MRTRKSPLKNISPRKKRRTIVPKITLIQPKSQVSKSSVLSDKSFIDCIHYIKANLNRYKEDKREQLVTDIYFVIEPRLYLEGEHPLINRDKLYENLINYTRAYWTKDDIRHIKNLVDKEKNHEYYPDVQSFLNQL